MQNKGLEVYNSTTDQDHYDKATQQNTHLCVSMQTDICQHLDRYSTVELSSA